jgi:hypothetical protein
MRWFRSAADSSEEQPADALLRRYRELDFRVGDDEEADAARAAEADSLAEELLRRDAEHPGLWFDRGMFAKWRRDWPAAQEHSARSLDLVPEAEREEEPAAWNLGIAATARRDWTTARRAWRAYGLQVGGEGDEPIEDDRGPGAVRLNPPVRYIGQQDLELDGRVGEPEVVWGLRLDPARIRIASVPLPGSGHRFGDVVLHDGEPHGTRRSGGADHPVFEEIELWERSPIPTSSVHVHAADEAVTELRHALELAELEVEDWTTEVGALCRACSEGIVDDHDHQPAQPADDVRRLGIAGDPAVARQVVADWLQRRSGREAGEVVGELP